jgi:hypothetical protein
MSKKVTEAFVPVLVATGQLMNSVRMKLSELKTDRKYTHREPEELAKPALQSLMDNIVQNGQISPILFAVENGVNVVVGGNRLYAAFEFLREQQTAGYYPDPEVLVQEVQGASGLDLLVRSLAGNAGGTPLSQWAKYRGAVAMHKAGADDKRIELALQLPDTSMDRVRRLIRHSWMFDHIKAKNIGLTDGNDLLEAAEKQNRVPQVIEDLEAQFDRIRAEIAKEDDERKGQKGDGLKDWERLVMRYLKPYQVKSWIDAVKSNERFEAEPSRPYFAYIEKAKEGPSTLKITPVSVKLVPAECDFLSLVHEKLAAVVKQLGLQLKFLRQQRILADTHEALLLDQDADNNEPAMPGSPSLTPRQPAMASIKPTADADYKSATKRKAQVPVEHLGLDDANATEAD